MNKSELVSAVVKDTGVSAAVASKVLDAVAQNTKAALARGEDVVLGDLGRLKIKRQEERKARNPQTGESITVAARNVVKFKASTSLAKAV